jgi:5-methylcytosine-specific restriction protein A
MLTLLTDEAELASAQDALKNELFQQLPQCDGKYVVGFQGDNIKDLDFYADDSIWFATQMAGKSSLRYWNAFGLTENIKASTSNSITVEINIPVKGENAAVAGLFARGDDGSVHLLHRGKIGGGRAGIGKQEFLDFSKLQMASVQAPNGQTTEAVLIGKLGVPSLAADIAQFVFAVANFKKFAASELGGYVKPVAPPKKKRIKQAAAQELMSAYYFENKAQLPANIVAQRGRIIELLMEGLTAAEAFSQASSGSA